jgi:phospholipid/cholesterol/gamma-HCH transport system substrate-binding protein
METRAHYVAVGAFVLIAIFAAFASVIWLGGTAFRRELEPYYIFFRGSVAGLSRGSPVQYNGIPVGRVTDIRVDKDDLSQIQVTVAIDTNLVEIKTDARAYLETNILSGVSIVQIRGGTQRAPVLEVKEGYRYPVIRAAESEFERVKASLPELSADLKTVLQDLNAMLDAKNREAVADSLQNVRTLTGALASRSQEAGAVIANANTALGSANAAFGSLNTLLHHVDQDVDARGGLKDRLTQTLNDYDRVASNLTDASRQLQSILAENRPGLHNFVDTTLPSIDDLVNDVQQLTGNLNQFVVQLQRDPTRLLFGDRRQGYQPR